MRTLLICKAASLLMALAMSGPLHAQSDGTTVAAPARPSTQTGVVAGQDALELYIQQGIDSNLVMQQKNVSLDKALLALRRARSLYAPTIAFQTLYQTGDGGRDIPLPLGDLLNGAYATLNQLTNSNAFPQLENQSINFFPRNFYDAKVRTTIPIYDKDLAYNKQISGQQVQLQEFEVAAYRRELVKEIKLAYYDHLRALQAVAIQRSALGLAGEGKRVNQKLLDNGKGLPAYLLRAESEIAAVEAQLTQAAQQVDNARLYFNMLLNRPATAAIDTSFNEESALHSIPMLPNGPASAQQREELQSLAAYIRLNETVLKMNKQFFLPKLGGFLDLGSQAEGFRFNKQSRYYLTGLQLDIPIFSGQRNKMTITETNLNLRNAQLNLQQVSQQLNLSAQVATNNLTAAWKTYQSTTVQLNAAETYQRLIDRGYQAGTNTYIETVDARNQLTTARLAATINKYNVLQAAAVLERETAAYSFPTKNQ
ncbi:MAG: TolC family protein [Candidatus Pseudobacter hemicellulosilyticus]|uniref:TolC family protein n=1 Tax=Candidatus Pseudobacter hemicellulosilyticus TaxID=3121375 RepID=A0AAJ5WPM6_9BACT|nr:MAG: TolC family protein [Pseudobacter sp.]